ncbi:hypothetical protein SLS62_001185 [Diatrype stigma]|uniref:Uncharacterized protein n=1 Tax=Diatrype stigma TaxID=117547 RepID=A0AAN9V1J8_9PEZI
MASEPDYSALTGEELGALAYAQSPIQPTGLGDPDPATEIPTLAKTGMLTFHESTQLPFVPAGALGIMAARYGLGARDADVNLLLKIRAREYALLYEMVYYASSTITKVAIAATILRICVKKQYKYIIWADMIIPFAANWNKSLGTYHHAPLIIWSELEGGFAIIAASLPALRKMFGRFFRGSSAGSKAKTASNTGRERSGLRGTQLASLTPQGKSRTMVSVGGGKWDRLRDENNTSSRVHIIKQTEVRIKETTPSELEADSHGTSWMDTDSDKINR